MITFELLYLIGVLVSFALLITLAIDEHEKGHSIEDFPAAVLLCILSWITVGLFIAAYHKTYWSLIKRLFKKN
jgi:hypothetical protein